MSNEHAMKFETCPSIVTRLDLKPGYKTIILDRDGTINCDKGYVHNLIDFKFTDQFKIISPLLAAFRGNICIITNQGGVSLGKFSQIQSMNFTNHVIAEMKKLGIKVCIAIACYHHDLDYCLFRKPNPGMVQFVLNELATSSSRCIYLGNDAKDRELAMRKQIRYVDVSNTDLERTLVSWMELD